jgi:hypothetical protein
MDASSFKRVKSGFFLGLWLLATSSLAADINPSLLKAKKDAEAKGYIFETSRDAIVAKARKEGRVKSLSSLETDVYPHLIEFQEKISLPRR